MLMLDRELSGILTCDKRALKRKAGCAQHGKLQVKRKKRRYKKMQWQFIVALMVAIPIILFPAAFIWYVNLGGIIKAAREARAKEKKLATVKAK